MKPACLKFVGALALMFACLQGGASIQTYDRTGCRMGVWTEDLKAARTYAAEHQSMIIVSFMRNDGSCGVCNSVSQSLFETDEFKATAARLDMPLVIANYSGNTYASQQIDCAQYESFPVIVFLASDGTTRLAWFYVSNVQTGNGTAPVLPKPSKGFKIDAIKDQFWEIAQRLISVQTDAPVAKNPTGSYKHRNHAAFEIAADDRKTEADELKIHTIWDVDGWTNSLQVRHWMNGKTLWALYDKQFDWWKFRNGKAGTSYRITTPTLNDPLDVGVVCVYTSSAAASAATTYDAAIANADWTCKLSDLPAGGTFTLPAEIPANQEIFVLFTRRNRADDLEEITLDYTFTLQEAENTSYYFTDKLRSEQAGKTLEIDVVRSTTAGAGQVKFDVVDIEAVTNADVTARDFLLNAVQAYEDKVGDPRDFVFLNADGSTNWEHVVSFADGQKTNSICLYLNGNTNTIQNLDRAFGISLQSDVAPDQDQAWHWTGVRIYDPNIQPDPDGDIGLNAETNTARSAEAPWVIGYLNFNHTNMVEDTSDVYYVTNLVSESSKLYGSAYYISARIEYIHNFATNCLNVRLLRAVKDGAPVVLGEKTLRTVKDNFVTFAIGVNSKDGWLDENLAQPEIILEVTRPEKAKGDMPTVCYSIQCLRFDRPLLAFDTAVPPVIRLDPDGIPSETNLGLHLDSIETIRNKTDADMSFTIDTGWQTVPAAKDPADPVLDYTPVTDGVCTNAYDTNRISVELMSRDSLSWPERSFDVRLLPASDDRKVYLLDPNGRTNVTVTFLADNVAPNPAATVKVPADGSWASTGEEARNLSYTNLADRIALEDVKPGTCYRLKADDVVVRPAGMEANVKVEVLTNSEPCDISFTLADLMVGDAEMRSPAFILPDSGSVQLEVSREKGEQVRVEYRLSVREEKDAGLDAADPADDVRSGAVEVPIAADGTETNLVRLLNGRKGAPNGVNDTNDWVRFTGILKGETYRFTVSTNLETNVSARVAFYRGDETEPFDDLDLGELVQGYRYDADSDDDVVVRVSRLPEDRWYAIVKYALCASRYVWPTVGFEKTAVEVTNDVASVTLKLVCTDNPGIEVPANVYVRNLGGRSGGYESTVYDGVEPSEVSFTVDQSEQTVAVTLRKPEADVWTGDWKFEVYAEVDPEWYRLADGVSNAVVTVVDATEQCDPTDPEDDEKSGATEIVLGVAASTNLCGHLNGIDTGREGAYSDRSDWLKIAWPNAETTCRLTLTDLVTNNCAGVALAAEVYRGATLFKSLSFAELVKGLDVPMTAAGEVVVRLTRGASDQEVPVAVEYELEVEEVAWPTFTVAANSPTVMNDEESVEFTVTRGANLESANEVKLIVSDTNAVKVTEGDATMQVPFAAGAETAVVEVPLVPGAKDYWKRGGPFEVTLAKSTVNPFVRIISPSNATVRVADASGIPENDYPADDTPAGAQAYPFDKEFQRATNYFDSAAVGCTNLWLNGSDTNDWFKFTDDDPAVSNKYRLAVRDFLPHDADGLDMTLTVYEGEQQAVPLTNTVLRAFERFDFRAQTDAGVFYVRVSRPYDGTRDVSVGYNLDFRKMPSAGISFVAAEGTVSEAAQAVYVELDCVVENEEPLEEDMVVTMTPTEIEEGGALTPAKPDLDYDPTPIEVTWKAGTLGGIQRIAVPLCNYDPTWRGERSFNLVLTSDSEAEVTTPDVMTVTILDSGYGTVGVTSTGDLTVPEGGFFPVRVERLDGSAGAVTGVWTWAVGKTKTVWKNLLFADRQAHATEVLVPVPVTAGYQATQAATLTFSIEVPAKTVTIRKGTPTSFKLTVLDATYGGALSEYAAGDRSKIGFRTSGNWYLAVGDGVLAAGTPAAGKSEAMTAQVTGPCKIVFDAELTDPSATWLDVFVGATKVVTLTSSSNDVEVAVDSVGVKTVKFSFGRNAKDKTGVGQAFVSNIRFVRAEAANTFGTFAGVASIQPAGGVKIPGSMTLTMSGAGRLSGKVVAADRTWTFQQAKGGWDGNAVRVVAKSGTDTLPITLTVDPATGVVTGEATEGTTAFAAELTRSCWQEKPLAAVAAEKIAFFAGYYTLALPSTLDLGSNPEYGSGYLTMTVSDAGAVKVSGKFADGVSANGSGTLGFAADGTLRAYVFIKPAAYRTGWFVAALAFGEEDGAPVVTRVVPEALAGIDCWVSSKSGDEFARSPLVSGGWYDRTENLHNYYYDSLVAKRSDGETDEVAVAFDESGNRLSVADYGAGLLTMSYARQTGIFTGLARYLESTVSRVIKKAVSYRGVLIPNTAGDPAVGRGYFVRDGKSMEIVIEEK